MASPARYCSAMVSSTSATVSISFSRAAAASSAAPRRSSSGSGASSSCPEKLSALHRDQIDDAAKRILGADRQLERRRARAQPRLASARRRAKSAPMRSILLMNDDARHVELVGLVPHRLRLRLDAVDAAEHHHRAVEHAQRALDLDGEVDVARRVDEVQLVALPAEGGGRGGDGDAALALLRHPVHLRLAVVDLADLVDAPAVEEEALGDRGLAGVDVRDDAEVANFVELRCLCHEPGSFSMICVR